MSLTPFEKMQSSRTEDSADGTSSGAPPTVPTRESPTPGGRKRPVKWLPFAIIGALVIGGLFLRSRGTPSGGGAGGGGGAGAGGPGGGNRPPEVEIVNVATVSPANLSQTLPLTGSLKSNQNIDLNSKIQGRVARVLVDEGDRIRRGQLLIQLDDADLRAQVASARANLSTAQARLQQSIAGLPAREQQVGTTIEQARAALGTARARYRQAVLNEPVQRQAAETQVATARETVRTAQARLAQARRTARQSELQTVAGVRAAEAGVRSAQAAVARSQASLAEVRRGSREQQIAQSQAQVNIAQAQLRDAETELNRQRQLFEGGATARATVDTAQTRFDVARANLEAAQQQLSLVREGATNEQIRQAEEAVRVAEEGVRQAQAQLGQARATRLSATNAQNDITTALAALGQAQSNYLSAVANLNQIPITRQETRTALENVRQAEAALSQAQANRSQIPIARTDIAIARAAVDTARAGVQTAQVNLDYAKIYSPVNGVVNQKLTGVGETAGAGAALLNLVSLERVYFEAQIPESSIRQVRIGQPATIFVPAVAERAISGRVTEIIPVSTGNLRQFRVRISIPDAPRQLTPGAFARGSLVTQQIFNTLSVPIEAVQEINGKPTVIAVIKQGEKNVVKYRTINTGLTANGKVQVQGGLRQGDLVVVDEAGLDDGEEVKLATA
jgi:HlyD family secretion protein